MFERPDLPRVPAGLVIVGLGLLWGAGFPAIEIVVDELPPLAAAGIRYGVSGCLVLLYAHLSGMQLLPRTRADLVAIAVVGGFMFGGYQAGLYLGTQYVSGAVASVVTTMSPVVAALVAVPFLGESRGVVDGVGFCLGVAGVVVLSRPSLGTTTVSTTTVGVGLVFVGTVLFAIGSVVVQRFDGDLPLEALQGWAMLVGASFLFVGSVARGETVPPLRTVSPLALASLLYITVIAGAGGYLLYFRSIRRVGATETTLVAYLEPVAATAVSTAFFSQTVGTTTVVGFLAVAAGFTLVSRETVRQTAFSIGAMRSEPAPSSEQRGD